MGSENVLKKLLGSVSPAETDNRFIQEFLKPEPVVKKKALRKPGRPAVPKAKKARNFTLCLAPQFVEFIDKMVVKDPKVKGRGRKIRFIIERFIEHEKRSIGHMKVLRDSLSEVEKTIQGFGNRVKKGEKLDLSVKERATITKAVDQVHLLLKILNYSPKVLHRMISREEWAILSFCLNWKSNRGVIL